MPDLEKGCTGYGVSTGLSSKRGPKMMEIMVKPVSPATALGYACCAGERHNNQ
jgi:hypothetical protein